MFQYLDYEDQFLIYFDACKTVVAALFCQMDRQFMFGMEVPEFIVH